jgi:hypothetical protein
MGTLSILDNDAHAVPNYVEAVTGHPPPYLFELVQEGALHHADKGFSKWFSVNLLTHPLFDVVSDQPRTSMMGDGSSSNQQALSARMTSRVM